MRICKTFNFEAAHYLPHVPEGHKCGGMHGHSYQVDVVVEGPVRDDGMVVDFAEIKAAWKPLGEQLDHQCLNGVRGLENPTSENLAVWIFDRLEVATSITVRETSSTSCTYAG